MASVDASSIPRHGNNADPALRAEIAILIDELLAMSFILTRELERQVDSVLKLLERLAKADLSPSAKERAREFLSHAHVYKRALIARYGPSEGRNPAGRLDATPIRQYMVEMRNQMSSMTMELYNGITTCVPCILPFELTGLTGHF